MKNCPTRERVKGYLAENPSATAREVQKALGLSSPSVANHHMRMLKYDRIKPYELIEENIKLRRRVEILERRLNRIAAAVSFNEQA